MQWNKFSIYGILAVLLWSTTIALTRSISEQLGPLSAGAVVHLVGGIIACIYLVVRKKLPFAGGKILSKGVVVTGILFILYSVCLFLAIGLAANRMQAIELGLVNYLWPGLTILLSLFLLSRRAGFWLIPGTLLAFTGIFLVVTQGSEFTWTAFVINVKGNTVAYLFAVVAAISWAFYSNLTRLWHDGSDSGFVPVYILVTGIILFGLRLFFDEVSEYSIEVWGEILVLSISTVLAYGFWELSMQKGDIAFVLSFSYLTPLFSTLVSTYYLGVMPEMGLWIGCTILIAGSFISWKSLID